MPDALPRLTVAALTHNGRLRPNNEDCIAVGTWLQAEPMDAPRIWEQRIESPLVCMVLDGMGGQASGEVASSLAAQYLMRELPACATEDAAGACIAAANRHLYLRMQEDAAQRGMGATLAGIRIAGDGILVFNVGDSRVYRVQDGFLSQLSVDDVRRMPRAGAGQRSGAITQSLGGTQQLIEIAPHVSRQAIAASRTYLLCSDGLYDALDIDAMESALDDDLAASASRLLERALAAGARDNLSIILIRLIL